MALLSGIFRALCSFSFGRLSTVGAKAVTPVYRLPSRPFSDSVRDQSKAIHNSLARIYPPLSLCVPERELPIPDPIE